MLNRLPKEHAFIEIENVLAARDSTEVHPNEIEEILQKYKLSEGDYAQRFVNLYGRTVEFFAQDRILSDSERHRLESLRKLLKINESLSLEVKLAVVLPMFEEVLRTAIEEGDVQDKNEKLLTIADNLDIPADVVRISVSRQASEVFSDAFNNAIADNRLSPDEETRLQRLMSQFNFQGSSDVLDDEVKARWQYHKALWSLSRGEFVEQNVNVRLQRGERCAYQMFVQHFESRTETRRIRYAGPTASIRVMKGVRFRLGDLAVRKVTEDVLKHLDSGILYLTTKRLLFDGEKKSASIPLNRIMNFSCYDDALVIEKDSGRDQVYRFSNAYDPRVIDATLDGLLHLHSQS